MDKRVDSIKPVIIDSVEALKKQQMEMPVHTKSTNSTRIPIVESTKKTPLNKSAAFQTSSRESIYSKFIRDHNLKAPPIASYRTNYSVLDRKVRAPLYGTEKTWGGEPAKKAKLIKELQFQRKVKKCDRIDKTLVYARNSEI